MCPWRPTTRSLESSDSSGRVVALLKQSLLYTGSVSWRWVFSSSLLRNPGHQVMALGAGGLARVMRWAGGGLLNLLLPDDCRICGEPLRELSRIPVCSSCLAEPQPLQAEFFCASCRAPFLNPYPLDETGRCALCRLGLQGFDAVYSYGSFEGTLRQLIHLFKYEGVQPLARVFGDRMALALPREQSFDAIVPMPLHWWKRWRRGYNQADLLAREIGRRWNVPVRDLMLRTRATATQAGLTNAQRRLNVRGAFRVKRGVRLDGRRILLVDDVFTTGATASACARALKRAGATRV
jgi:ComF family protein